jgi:ELWxxDGT repeat protein
MRIRAAVLLLLTCSWLGGARAVFPAGTAHLLVDANPGPPDLARSFGYAPPRQFAELAGRAVFLVDSNIGGDYRFVSGPQVTLWASDGTPGGTELLATFCQDGFEGCHHETRLLGQTGGVAFLGIPMPGYDNYFRRELWRTDGTVEGTYRLSPELCPGGQDGGGTEVIAGGALYFAGFDADTGCEPWVSDGTPAGTERLADLHSGGPESSNPQSFAAVGDRVYFTSGYGGGLWVTDGTPGGTALVHPFDQLQLATAVGRRLFFMVPVGSEISLWTSDGTAAGTHAVRSFPNATCRDCDPVTSFLKPDGDGVLFLVGDGQHGAQLWRSDGTPGGTRLLLALRPGTYFGLNGFDPSADLVDLGPSLLFLVRTTIQLQLWTSRPPAAPAARLKGCPGGCPEVLSRLQPVPGSSRVVFAGREYRSRTELWVSDGTAAGTRPLRGLCSGPCDPFSQGIVAVGGAVYFSTADAAGGALWRTDGTPAGTVLLGRASLPLAAGGIALNGRVLLGAASGARTSELWATGGTAATTERVKTFSRVPTPSSDPRFTPLGGRVVFTTQAGTGSAVWASNGTSTRRLISLPAACGPPCVSFTPPVTAGGLAFTFAGLDTDAGLLYAHLVRTDGTPEGTREIHDFGSSSLVLHPLASGGRLIFLRCDDTHGTPNYAACDLWASDGTAEGTAPFAALPPSVFIWPSVAIGSRYYLFLAVQTGTTVLYRSDGIAAGIQPLASVDPRAYNPLEIAEAGGEVYVTINGGLGRLNATEPGGVSFFFGRDVTGITELNGRLVFFGASREDSPRTGLWSTDGTLEGTELLAPVLEQLPQFNLGIFGPPQWTRLGTRLLFRGWDPEHGFELWATDGTPGGTFLVKDILPGKGSSFPDSLTLAGGEVWFNASDGVHGKDLWVSDGTPGGTRLALDLAPGPRSSSPQGLTPAGANLFFSADLTSTGREPWVLPLQ